MLTLNLLSGALLFLTLFFVGFIVGFLLQLARSKTAHQNELLNLYEKIGQLQASLQNEKEKITLMEEAKKQLRDEFTLLSQTILDEKTLKFTQNNSQQLGLLLNPLRDQLGEFEKKLRETHYQQTQERLSLVTEIKHLKELNQKMGQEALNLTQALRGNNKLQGCWGEVILTRILEKSGLQEGREYEIQMHATNEDGKIFRPDVVVRLPEGRDIIIDSKVSLVAYLRFQEAENEEQKETALTQHIASLRQHIKSLASKEYQKIASINSLDFVLLFLPIEAALTLALQNEAELFNDALEMNVILVTPTTLLTTLRTVNTLWRIEQQNKNALEIATRAGDLYDKLVTFVEDLQDVSKKLDAAQKSHEAAVAKLSTGRGNLISRVEGLRKLGAKVSKSLPVMEEE